jgi:hypothetical protein
MSWNKVFVIYGIKISEVPADFIVDNNSQISPLRQYAAHLRKKRDESGHDYRVHVGTSSLYSIPSRSDESVDRQATDLAIFVGLGIHYTQVEKFPAAIAALHTDPTLPGMQERCVYGGLSWFDEDTCST